MLGAFITSIITKNWCNICIHLVFFFSRALTAHFAFEVCLLSVRRLSHCHHCLCYHYFCCHRSRSLCCHYHRFSLSPLFVVPLFTATESCVSLSPLFALMSSFAATIIHVATIENFWSRHVKVSFKYFYYNLLFYLEIKF